MSTGAALHHLHTRKRIYKNLEKYPHPQRLKNLLDRSMYAVGIIMPVMTIPQILKIWQQQDAANLSLITWVASALSGLFFLGYAVVHKDKPLVAVYSASFVTTLVVVIETIVFG